MKYKNLPVKAWAIKDGGKIMVFDARCPVYWLRRVAASEAAMRGLVNAEIVRVSIKDSRR